VAYRKKIESERSKSVPTPEQASEVLYQHPALPESVRFAESARRTGARSLALTPTMVAFTHYLLSQIDDAQAKDFWERLLGGVNLQSNSPVLILRRQLEREAVTKRSNTREDRIAWLIKAWNADRDGRTQKASFSWRSGETFPKPH
jgi:hypothetical protein